MSPAHRPPKEPPDYQPLGSWQTADDQATAWRAATQADLYRLLDRSAANNARTQRRAQEIADAQAAALVGHPVDTAREEDEMDVRVNSPSTTTINNPPAPLPPPPPSWAPWAKVAIAALATLVLLAILWRLAPPVNPNPTPTPAPDSGWQIK